VAWLPNGAGEKVRTGSFPSHVDWGGEGVRVSHYNGGGVMVKPLFEPLRQGWGFEDEIGTGGG